MKKKEVIIIGAGPAGLTAGLELLKKSKNYHITILEATNAIGGISKTAKYKVLFSAPNIFEIYSTHNYIEGEVSEGSTWFINSSLEEDTGVIVDTYGDVTETVYNEDVYGIRAVAYIKKNQNVSGGSGTYDDPYTIR